MRRFENRVALITAAAAGLGQGAAYRHAAEGALVTIWDRDGAALEGALRRGEAGRRPRGLDLVVANDITKAGAGFNTDTNIATILTRTGGEVELPLMSKRAMADRILDEIIRLRKG